MTKGFAITFDSFNLDVSKVVNVSEYEIDLESLKPNQIALEALAAPVNPSDLLQIKGVYTQPTKQSVGNKDTFIGGNEGVFKILNKGSEIKGFNVGDWVIPLLSNFGTWRSHAIVDFNVPGSQVEVPVIKVRDSTKADTKITIDEAATISVNPPTALQMLQNYVTFDKDGKDWVIQNAGASQVSKFVLQFAKILKINVISVIRGGKPNHKEIEDELLALGAAKVITEEQSQSEEYQKTIIPGWVKATGGSLKLGLNSVGGALASALIQSLGQNSFLVSYGQMDPAPIQYTSGLQLFKNLTTVSYWISRNTQIDPPSKVKTIDEVLQFYESGAIKNVEFSKNVYDLSSQSSDKFLEAFHNAIKNSSSGKQVIIFN